MVDILSRVPVKDLRRSTCVSKPWRDLITDPLNRKKLPQTLEGFFHGGGGGHHNYGHFTSLSASGECVPPVDPSFSFITTKLPGVERLALLDSRNGLQLFGCSREDRFGYIVCNPATEELVTVPASSASCPPPPPHLGEGYYDADDEDERCAHTFLIFDPAVSWHFHLVQIWEDTSVIEVETVHSYSSETRVWTDRSSKWKRGEEGGEWGLWGKAILKFTCGAVVNGLLHFVVFGDEKYENLIVAVDGEGKTCRIIDWPDKHASTEAAFFGQSQGHLNCIVVNMQSQLSCMGCFNQLSIWVLEDYDTQHWILKHNVSTSQLFGTLRFPVDNLDIVAIHPDHNVIFLFEHYNQKFVSYNMNSKELCALCTLGDGDLLILDYPICSLFHGVISSCHQGLRLLLVEDFSECSARVLSSKYGQQAVWVNLLELGGAKFDKSNISFR